MCNFVGLKKVHNLNSYLCIKTKRLYYMKNKKINN